MGLSEVLRYDLGHVTQLFRNPVVRRDRVEGTYHLHLDRPLVCFNSLHLNRELGRVPADASDVVLHIGENVAMIDHTSCDTLMHFAEEFERHGTARVEINGLDRVEKRSRAETAMRLAPIPAMAVAVAAGALHEDTLAEVQESD